MEENKDILNEGSIFFDENSNLQLLTKKINNLIKNISVKRKEFSNFLDFKKKVQENVILLYDLYKKITLLEPKNKKDYSVINKNIYKLCRVCNKYLKDLDEHKNKTNNKDVLNQNKDVLNQNKDVILKASNIFKFYCSNKMMVKILDNVSIEINEGDFVVILGPSGSGKTTLMNLLSGMDKPTFGSMWVNGYHLEEMNSTNLTLFRKNNIGYVFQRYGLLPNLTVFENVLMGNYLGKVDTFSFGSQIYKKTSYSKQELKKIMKEKKDEYEKNKDQIDEEINKILEYLDLKNYSSKYPYELSGGQKQRTSIARTIAKKPKIIYGDEPTAAVDSEMSKVIIETFAKINNDLTTTIIIITHDESIAKFANKVIYLLDGKINKVINKEKGQLINYEDKKN